MAVPNLPGPATQARPQPKEIQMMMQPPQGGQPSQAADPMAEAPPEAETGYTVCIECKPDGTFMVGLDSDDAPQPTGPGAAPDPDIGMKPARDVKDALTIALQIIKAGGKDQSGQDFANGYDQTELR